MKTRLLFACLAILLLVAAVFWRTSAPSSPPTPVPQPESRPVAADADRPQSGASAALAADTSGANENAARLRSYVDTLRTLAPALRRERVELLLHELDALPPAARSDAVLAFLRTGLDVEIGGTFALGEGGWLRDWPTLRVALLDYLARHDSAAAALVSREILAASVPALPDEWAVALRELARGRRAEDWPPLVSRRLVELLGHPEWSAQTPAAYLEAFDVIVAGGAVAVLPQLARIATEGTPAARFAAFLAADRLVLAQPVAALTELNRQPALFADQPQVRAGLFARADIREPEQRSALEAYFRRTDIDAAERQAFAGLFPLYDLAISNNLLTPPARRSLVDMESHDRAVLQQLAEWQRQPELSRWSDVWPAITGQLQQHLGTIR